VKITFDNSPVLFDYPKANSNVFIMMRFCATKEHNEILQEVREALRYYGLNGLRADDKNYAESIWTNIKSYLDACDMGIAVFEQIEDNDFNPNVSLELGYMMAQKKHVLLLKENRLKALPTDVVGNLYKPFDSHNLSSSIRPSILQWLRDIGVAKFATERVVLFVSYGGTCRCAMAKVALEQALVGRQLPFRLRAISVAYMFGPNNEASKGARRAVYDTYGSDLLEEHRVTRRNPGLLADADLILVMEEQFRVGLPTNKTFCFNEFLGLEGDVHNPWPDEENDAAHERYRNCMRELRVALEQGADKILNYVDTEQRRCL
jgi:nucleoside 2-deoxyribosyltransferase/protein-tyrosine-phosphatase